VQQKEFARQVVKEFGIAPNDICALQKMEWSKLLATWNAVAAKINLAMRGFMFGPPSSPGRVPRVGWTPTLDGRVITLKSFDDTAPEVSKNVPMLICSVSEEIMRYKSNPTGIDRPPWEKLIAVLNEARLSFGPTWLIAISPRFTLRGIENCRMLVSLFERGCSHQQLLSRLELHARLLYSDSGTA
jgi:hypothetical protein